MLKLILAGLALAFAAFALWRQTARATPRRYTKVHVVGTSSQPAHPELERAERSALASSYRRKHLLTPAQLITGLAICGVIYVVLAIAAVLFTHQHFHIKARLGLERPAADAGPATP